MGAFVGNLYITGPSTKKSTHAITFPSKVGDLYGEEFLGLEGKGFQLVVDIDGKAMLVADRLRVRQSIAAGDIVYQGIQGANKVFVISAFGKIRKSQKGGK
jgi:hypothetical protein